MNFGLNSRKIYPMVNLAQTIADIKSLKIQGATNIARSALNILSEVPENRMAETIEELVFSRPTEPLLQNCLSLVKQKGKSVIPIILSRLRDVEEQIINNGVPLIKENSTVLTHCHSSSVVNLLKYVKKKGINFKVFLTETRPVFQGRITAKELTRARIPSTMITDSEAAFLISKEDNKDIDIIFLGADAMDNRGSVFNKVGSYAIALSASKARIPIYIVSTLLKFSLKPVVIEERKSKEIWPAKPKALKILNPAFDKIPAELITGIVTEFGIIKPEKIKTIVKKNYPWITATRAGDHKFSGAEVARQQFLSESNRSLKEENHIQKNSLKDFEKIGRAPRALQAVDSPYKSYLHINEKVNPKNHIIADFILTVGDDDFLEAAGGIAAESSVGTWTEVSTQLADVWDKLHARVLEADRKTGILKIAYPLDLFEKGNIPQLLSSIAGNIYGLREVANLKLTDINLPEDYVKSFPGPAVGIDGIRKISGVYDRPLIGCIIKPKLGLDFRAHAQVVKDVYEGGVNFVKDDENLTSQTFNPFEKRVREIARICFKNADCQKIYAFNITASADTMLTRAEFIKENKGNCAMIDFLTAGFSGLQSLRNHNYNLIIHGHRAMHAALDRVPNHGISMLVLSKLARLSGIDSLHTGTVIGKMEGGAKGILAINKFLLGEWYGLKPVLPVASGGLYPGLVPDLIKIFGKDVLLNFGGGIHGHPGGSKLGASAVLEAVTAFKNGISLSKAAKSNPALAQALIKWKINK